LKEYLTVAAVTDATYVCHLYLPLKKIVLHASEKGTTFVSLKKVSTPYRGTVWAEKIQYLIEMR